MQAVSGDPSDPRKLLAASTHLALLMKKQAIATGSSLASFWVVYHYLWLSHSQLGQDDQDFPTNAAWQACSHVWPRGSPAPPAPVVWGVVHEGCGINGHQTSICKNYRLSTDRGPRLTPPLQDCVQAVSAWPQALLYAFLPFSLLQSVLCQVQTEEARLILVALLWPYIPWISAIPLLLAGTLWELPV